MRLYYDHEGIPQFTMICQGGFSGPDGLFIDVPEGDMQLDQWRVVDGALVPLSDKMLADAKMNGIAKVNNLSGEIRKRYVTEIPAQQMLYMRKEAEAKAWIAATDPNVDEYPYIKSEIGITAETADMVAMVYLNQAYYLDVEASNLEVGRLGTISVIEGASDVNVISQAVDAFVSGVSA